MTSEMFRVCAATGCAIGGAIIGCLLENSAPRYRNLLIYSALGILLSVTVCDILPDAKMALGWPLFLLSVLSGTLLLWCLSSRLGHVCPSCGDHEESKLGSTIGPTIMLLSIGLAIHSMLDGVAIITADKIEGQSHLAVWFAISAHKLPEGLALVLLLTGAGYSRLSSLIWTSAIEMTTLLGGFLAMTALRTAPVSLLGVIAAHIGGGFLFLAANTLIVRSQESSKFVVRPKAAITGVSFGLTSFILLVAS